MVVCSGIFEKLLTRRGSSDIIEMEVGGVFLEFTNIVLVSEVLSAGMHSCVMDMTKGGEALRITS